MRNATGLFAFSDVVAFCGNDMFTDRSTSVQGTVTLRVPLQCQPRMYTCCSCLSLVPMSSELVLNPGEVMEDARVLLSLHL